jgi:hypothetical protein
MCRVGGIIPCILYLGPGKGGRTLCPDLFTEKGPYYLPKRRVCEDQGRYGISGEKGYFF